MSAPSTIPKLFTPTQVGDLTLNHRIVLAPLTRNRADEKHVPSINAAEYYSQRGSVPGTLLITEATLIAQKAGGMANVPGIWSDEQISKWKEIITAVHSKGSFIYLQIWAFGRAADPDQLSSEDDTLSVVSSSDVPITGSKPPRPLSEEEIKEYIQLYATAASNAVDRAGFDGVEIHGANGYLVDQFTQTNSNKRTDAYGGTHEKRARFALEVTEAVTKAVGQAKTGIRLSPWSTFQDMRMEDSDIHETFSYLVSQLSSRFPNMAYLHLVEPRILGDGDVDPKHDQESNDFIRKIWAPKPLISAGGHDRQRAIEAAEQKDDLTAFGRYFISNPDLPRRLKEDIDLTKYDRKTFYLLGDTSGKGYTDYPFAPPSVL